MDLLQITSHEKENLSVTKYSSVDIYKLCVENNILGLLDFFLGDRILFHW
jgi:hypothetical protein